MNKKHLLNRRNFGYAFGHIGQGASYSFISTYFVVYMTNCVGTSSTTASSIMSIALLVEVFAGTIAGNMSDRCRLKMGRRRPFILFSAFLMPIVLIAIFTPFQDGKYPGFAYYLIFSILFRIAFSSYEIPNGAFGADIASDYDDRTRLKTLSRYFGVLGNLFAYITPLIALDMISGEKSAWLFSGVFIGAVCMISWLISFFTTKGADHPFAKVRRAKSFVLKDVIVNYFELLHLRPMRWLIIYKMTFTIALSLYSVAMIYYLKYCVGMSNAFTSKVYLLSIAVSLAATPIANKRAISAGKNIEQRNMMLLAGTTAIAVFIFAADKAFGAILYITVFSAMHSTFWQISPSIFYDMTEVDEFVNGKRREGDIVSMVSVLGTVISSIMIQLFGTIYDASGFDPDLTMQPDLTISLLKILFLLVPGIVFFVGAFALQKFPITKERFALLQAAVKAKNSGSEISSYLETLKGII